MPERTSANTVLVIFFDDIQGSTVLKRILTERADEDAFQKLRQEHDALVTELVTRGGAGKVIKSTGDGIMAFFHNPSLAVERAVELQERLHGHPHLSVRVGIDMGEVRVESVDGTPVDIFGRHVDTAARASALVDGGHICVTASVYVDAFSWLTKNRIAWKAHGLYQVKPSEPFFETYEPYNANITRPSEALRGTKADAKGESAKAPPPLSEAPPASRQLRIVRPWEAVARDGRDFAEKGAGMMYWFKVPLGGVCYPEGFRGFLLPALANPRITKIRFVLDSANPAYRQIWEGLVLPLLADWAKKENRAFRLDKREDGGRLAEENGPKTVEWVYVNLAGEVSPCFKLFVDDPDNDLKIIPEAQIFLASSARTVRFADGSSQSVRIPDAILRVSSQDDEALIHGLNSLANQWDMLFG